MDKINIIHSIRVGEWLPPLTTVDEMMRNYHYSFVIPLFIVSWLIFWEWGRRSDKKEEGSYYDPVVTWIMFVLWSVCIIIPVVFCLLLSYRQVGSEQYLTINQTLKKGYLTKDDVKKYLEGKGFITVLEYNCLASIANVRIASSKPVTELEKRRGELINTLNTIDNKEGKSK